MTDVATLKMDRIPDWTTGANPQFQSMYNIRYAQNWMLPHLMYKGSGISAYQIPGHTLTKSGTSPEYAWIALEDPSPGTGSKWRATLTWSGGVITDVVLAFAEDGSTYVDLVVADTGSVVRDSTLTKAFYFDSTPTSFKTTFDAHEVAMCENFLALLTSAAYGADDFTTKGYYLNGWDTTVTGGASTPTSIDLLRASGVDGPDIKFDFEYQNSLLWRVKLSVERADAEDYYDQEHYQFARAQNGDIISCRSILSTASTALPPARMGATAITSGEYFDLPAGSEVLHDWDLPASGTWAANWTRANIQNQWALLMTQAFGGSDPLRYFLPRMSGGHWATLFFYDSTQKGTGEPSAVEAAYKNICIRWELTYSGGDLTTTKWYWIPGVGCGWLYLGTTTAPA